jgi:hypothetical protein
MHFPATEALQNQEKRRVGLVEPSSSGHSKVSFDMNSLFDQAVALDSAAFASSPFPSISWSFDTEVSGMEKEAAPRKKNSPRCHKKFDDMFKCHRRTMRAKHGMVRSKALTGLSRLAGSTSSSLHRINSIYLTASS